MQGSHASCKNSKNSEKTISTKKEIAEYYLKVTWFISFKQTSWRYRIGIGRESRKLKQKIVINGSNININKKKFALQNALRNQNHFPHPILCRINAKSRKVTYVKAVYRRNKHPCPAQIPQTIENAMKANEDKEEIIFGNDHCDVTRTRNPRRPKEH